MTSDHSLLDVQNSELSLECQHHSGELIRFYCDTCNVCVCVLCTYRGQPHSDNHDVLSFSDAMAVHQAPFTALLTDSRRRLCDVRARYDAVIGFDQLIRKVSKSSYGRRLAAAVSSCYKVSLCANFQRQSCSYIIPLYYLTVHRWTAAPST